MKLEPEYYDSPRWTTEILDCSMPMTFDTYSNCAFQCVYCFAFFQRAVGKTANDYLHHKVKAVNVEKIKRMFSDPDNHGGSFGWYIKQRHVLQWGGLSDGFDWYEKKFRKSLELLRFFREIDYPLSISTKGVWWLDEPEYTDIIKGWKNIHWKFSIITTDPEKAKKIEPGTPSPQARFEALSRLKNEFGNSVTTRFRPYVIGVSDLTVREMFEESKRANVDSITTEFLCLERRASNTAKERYRIISEQCGFNVFEFYKKNSKGSGLMRLNYDLKRPYFEEMQALSDEFEIPLYISDAHHKERSPSCGCCGLPTQGDTDLKNAFEGHFAEAILIAKKNGLVYWEDIAHLAEPLKQIGYKNAQGYNVGNTYNRARGQYWTMWDFMKNQWNNIKSFQSPAKYFGGALVPAWLDKKTKNIVYVYNRPYIEDGYQVNSVAELLEMVGLEMHNGHKN
jgi:DNA repair photolyase